MNKLFLSAVIFILLISGCKQTGNTGKGTSTGVDTAKYFQVPAFIEKDIKEVNTTPFFMYKIETAGDRRDSAAIDKNQFNHLSSTFTKTDLNNEDIKQYYTESIFEDRTTKTFTINYSTTNKDLEVQNVDVLLKEDGQTVKRIMIRKFYNYTDSTAIEQLSWKPGESFQVVRSVQKADNTESIKQTMVVWNAKS